MIFFVFNWKTKKIKIKRSQNSFESVRIWNQKALNWINCIIQYWNISIQKLAKLHKNIIMESFNHINVQFAFFAAINICVIKHNCISINRYTSSYIFYTHKLFIYWWDELDLMYYVYRYKNKLQYIYYYVLVLCTGHSFVFILWPH